MKQERETPRYGNSNGVGCRTAKHDIRIVSQQDWETGCMAFGLIFAISFGATFVHWAVMPL